MGLVLTFHEHARELRKLLSFRNISETFIYGKSRNHGKRSACPPQMPLGDGVPGGVKMFSESLPVPGGESVLEWAGDFVMAVLGECDAAFRRVGFTFGDYCPG
ncbi:MAG: hypothetical protein WC637_19085 [Victivallales bacterium]